MIIIRNNIYIPKVGQLTFLSHKRKIRCPNYYRRVYVKQGIHLTKIVLQYKYHLV